jgi:molybdate transport system substrate-binding protein
VELVVILRGLSSMATRGVLTALTAHADLGLGHLTVRSAGGVEVAQRLREGEVADVVVLSHNAIEALATERIVDGRMIVPLFRSDVVVAVPRGVPVPDVSSVGLLIATIIASRRIGYSTGPSGSALLELVQSWGLNTRLADRWIQAPPGVPVAQLLADGVVDLGFQQRSELATAPGVTVRGMPPGAEIVTIFSGAVPTVSEHPAEAMAALTLLADPAAHEVILRHALAPAT